MDILLLLALVAFLASAIWSTIQRAWPLALLAAGLLLIVLPSTGLITS